MILLIFAVIVAFWAVLVLTEPNRNRRARPPWPRADDRRFELLASAFAESVANREYAAADRFVALCLAGEATGFCEVEIDDRW